MTVIATALGSNSTVLDYSSGSTALQLCDAAYTFLTTHGWTSIDAAPWDSGSYKSCRAYKALNKDGVTYKYIVVEFYLTTHMLITTCESYSNHVSTNECHHSGSYNTYGGLRLHLTTGGFIYLFATDRWAVAHSYNNANQTGTSTGEAFVGCVEITAANSEDDPASYPTFAWVNGYLLGGEDSNSHYAVSPPRSRLYTASSASIYTRISTPIAAWGYGQYSSIDIGSVMPSTNNPWNGDYHCFNITVSYDTTGTSHYVKGKMYGLKVLSRGVGILMDTMKVSCDSDNFTTVSGSNVDHAILTVNNSFARYGIPL